MGPGTMSKAFSRLEVQIPVKNLLFGCVFVELCHFFSFLLNFQAVIKLAASAASPKTKIQESRRASGGRLGWRATEMARLPWIPGFWKSGRLR